LLSSIAPYSTVAVGKEVQDDQRLLLISCQALAAQPEPTKSNACVYYIQGFLAGANFADTVNATPSGIANNQWSSFLERAYRTRVGDKPGSKQPRHFCLPDDESLSQVINVLSRPLSSPVETIEMLSARIIQVLKSEYPCG
jgi:hypothetical protein